MLTEVNTKSSGQYLPEQPEEGSALTLANSKDQVHGSENICKLLSDPLDLTQRLYFEELLPNLKSTGQPFIKVSRRKYEFLENSILAHKSGKVYGQYHWNDKKGAEIISIKDKGLCGQGAYKRVWDLKPLFPNDIGPPMVRTRFNWESSRCNNVLKLSENLEILKSEVNSRFLLIPETITYISTCGISAVVQTMPKAIGGDVFKVLKKLERLSYLGRLRVMRDVGLGLIDMHEKSWVHLDIKPGNIVLMDQDPNNPVVKIADFDMARKLQLKEASTYCVGTILYMDPKCLNKKSSGLEDGKIHDQFSFGITQYELLTGLMPRENFKAKELREWVTEQDLNASPDFLGLNNDIQRIIIGCCVGSTDDRPYKLPDFVAILDKVINNFVMHF